MKFYPPGRDNVNFEVIFNKRSTSPGFTTLVRSLARTFFAVAIVAAACIPLPAYAQGTCAEWSDAAIGAPLSGSTSYEACNPGTVTITSAGAPSGTADKQYMVQRELCGNGELWVKVLGISNGFAGIEIRANNTSGATKAGLKTGLTPMLTRYVRSTTSAAQTTTSTPAAGHQWLKVSRNNNNINLYHSPNGTNWSFFCGV
ncbi:MAG: hypothetical protein KF852_03710 [Saprospiraceae bacterium]|nr:hypothetical protein [Saprospiraceae bacterium]